MDPFCFRCNGSYSVDRPPFRLRNCGHHLCKPCLLQSTACPIDRKLIDQSVFQFNDSEIDFDLLKGFNSTLTRKKTRNDQHLLAELQNPKIKINQTQLCLLHSRQADLICLNDQQIVCSNCALFGEHRGHMIENKESLLKKLGDLAEGSLYYYERLKMKEVELQGKKRNNTENIIMVVRKKEAIDQVKQKFKKISQSVRKLQRECLQEIQNIYNFFNDKVQNMIDEGLKQNDNEEWYGNVENVGRIFQSCTDLKSILEGAKYLKKYQTSQDLIQQGKKREKNLEDFQRKLADFIEHNNPKVNLFFDETLQERLKEFCKVKIIKNNIDQYKNIKIKQCQNYGIICETMNENYEEDQFLLGEGQIQQFQNHGIPLSNNCSTISTIKPLLNQTISKIQYQTTPRQSLGSRSNSQQRLSFENRISLNYRLPSSTNLSLEKRILRERFLTDNNQSIELRKKKTQIPAKYKNIIEQLKNDKLETLDLGSADLPDSSILTLCSYICRTKKLKTVKLMKNKVTQQSLYELIKSCSESKVVNLNLSQNLLTDKAIGIIQSMDLKQLKNITLSLNKINRRCVKSSIDSVQKKGVTLTI